MIDASGKVRLIDLVFHKPPLPIQLGYKQRNDLRLAAIPIADIISGDWPTQDAESVRRAVAVIERMRGEDPPKSHFLKAVRYTTQVLRGTDSSPKLPKIIEELKRLTNSSARTSLLAPGTRFELSKQETPPEGIIALKEAKWHLLERALYATGGTVTRAAELTGISCAQICVFLKSHGRNRKDYDNPENRIDKLSIKPLDEEEREIMTNALKAANWNYRLAAKWLGVDQNMLYRRRSSWEVITRSEKAAEAPEEVWRKNVLQVAPRAKALIKQLFQQGVYNLEVISKRLSLGKHVLGVTISQHEELRKMRNDKMLELRIHGKTMEEIGKIFGVSQGVICKWVHSDSRLEETFQSRRGRRQVIGGIEGRAASAVRSAA